MSIDIETIQKLTLSEKAEIYQLLGNDEALNEYLYKNERLFDELRHRDEQVANGEMQLLTRQELTQRLKQRRNAL